MASTSTNTRPISLKVNAALFDVDGTLIISQGAIAEFWRDFGKDKPYFDTQHVIDISHGWRTYDVIKKFAPDYANEEYVTKLEGEIPDRFGQHAVEVSGAVKLCAELNKLASQGKMGCCYVRHLRDGSQVVRHFRNQETFQLHHG